MGFSNLPKSTTILIDQIIGTSATLCRRYLAIQRSSPISIPSHGPIYVMMVMVTLFRLYLNGSNWIGSIWSNWIDWLRTHLELPLGRHHLSICTTWNCSMKIRWMWFWWFKSWRWASPHIGQHISFTVHFHPDDNDLFILSVEQFRIDMCGSK